MFLKQLTKHHIFKLLLQPLNFQKSDISSIYDSINLKNQLSQIAHDAIRYKLLPSEKRELTYEEKNNDRIVQSYFSYAEYNIRVYESINTKIDNLQVNYPRNCYYEVILPCKTNKNIAKLMELFDKRTVRLGRLFELYDYVATTVAYKYVYVKQAVIMAACVDNIQFYQNVCPSKDIVLRGYPTFIGSSSIEVQLDLLQENIDTQQLQLIGKANFLLVARNKDNIKFAHLVPKLLFDEENNLKNCQLLYLLGQQNQQQRKNASLTSLKKQPPSQQENLIIHNFFTSEDMKKNKRQINHTRLDKNIIMHKQDSNLHGNIFGGYLMREAYELGWLCGTLHAETQQIVISAIDDFQFINGVEVGSILELNAQVGYVSYDNVMHIVVECFSVNKQLQVLKTNDLHLTFVLDQLNPIKIQQVYPNTYKEAMVYLDSQRRVKKCMHNH
ncbi:hypothetical protein IMG5_136230 [Ichthyophthirius multifiliis]|uniref:HotDog ACOT-type domain-containing protein n=1 Tax=Ichthyophthirius multifiliis TaxID=5932 RepID=G0QWX9_ICHMU|nr:hypothetical protein IMG5_136230 [Ichthyophthirius multifiliis]EGR30277.1 hypothetical protein IMG5_136230 [Ichthyophthirius multifiliis]|eukprot:XP_004031864.1 hypothetical protein IMG5_136230 [Ichthyophthirius multifiliis]